MMELLNFSLRLHLFLLDQANLLSSFIHLQFLEPAYLLFIQLLCLFEVQAIVVLDESQ